MPMTRDVRTEHCRVHPGISVWLQRAVALAVRTNAAELLVKFPQSAPCRDSVQSSVREQRDVVERPQQPLPGALFEVREVVHASGDSRMRHLKQQRMEHAQIEPGVAREPPGDRT